MSNPIHPLAQRLTGQSTLEECSLDEVKRIVQRYPFFAPAQFLFLQKLRQSGLSEEADAQYKKAVLFYPDPLAFDVFISSGKFYGRQAQEFSTQRIDDASQPMETVDDLSVIKDEPSSEEESILVKTEEASPFLDSSANEKVNQETAMHWVAEEPLPNTANAGKSVEEKNITVEKEEAAAVSSEPLNGPIFQPHDEKSTEALPNEPLAFEPYHTVDYFASQGIRISADDLPKDKLGKQLKSFTQWLKTMKRLPASQTADTTERLAEIGVENMASRSVSDSEVLTEAMAEVWAKQGSPEKALDIYNKLSLHNPSKRDYFAAKIENLKPS